MWEDILKDDNIWSDFQEVLDKYPALEATLTLPSYMRSGTFKQMLQFCDIHISWGDEYKLPWESLLTREVYNYGNVVRTIKTYYILGNKDKYPEFDDFYDPKLYLGTRGDLKEESLEAWSSSLKALDWFIRSVPKDIISANDNVMYLPILGGTMSVPLTSNCENSYENDDGQVFNMCIRARNSGSIIASADNWLSYYLIYSQLGKLGSYDDIEELAESLNLPDVIHQTIRGSIVVRCGVCEEVKDDINIMQTYEWECDRCGFINEYYDGDNEIASEEGIGPYIQGNVSGFECPFGHRVYSEDYDTCDVHYIKAIDGWPSQGWEHVDYDFEINGDYFYIHDDKVLNVDNVMEYDLTNYISGVSMSELLGHGADVWFLENHPNVEEIGQWNNNTLWKGEDYYYYYDDNNEIEYSETNPNDEEE